MRNSQRTDRLVVLGLGNVLCGDDGLGVVAVASLRRRYEIPDSVEVLDGGTLGLALLSQIQESDDVILVDAIRADGSPGELVRLEGDEVAPAVRDRLSVHQVGVADLLDALRWVDAYPRRLILLGLIPETLELRLSRSSSVEAEIPRLVEGIVKEAFRMGYVLNARNGTEARCLLESDALSRALGL